jgi:SAM-dependent methyltransferase
LAEQLEYVRCLLCGGDDTEVRSESHNTKRKIVRCRRDGLIYLNPRPDAEAQRTFFSEWEYIANRDPEWYEVYKSSRRPALRREAALIKRLKPEGGNLLDVACGIGTFLENFSPPREWRLFGVDESRLSVEIAAACHRAKLLVGTLRDARYPDSFFDAVSFLDALYYFHDPLSELLEVRRILKPEGLFALEIPGLRYTLFRKQGAMAWALNGKWSSLTPEYNILYYFSPTALKRLLTRAGFSVLKVVPEQALLGQNRLGRLANHLQFNLARMVFVATRGRLSIAAREFYLNVKDSGWTPEPSADISLPIT